MNVLRVNRTIVIIGVLFISASAVDAQVTNISTLNSLPTGNHSFTADGQTFNGYVENIGGTGWLLVGRGRNGWEFDNDGQGAVSSVNQGLGTNAAFTPALYSDAIVNNLISNSSINLTNTEIRIRRAAESTGTSAYQEARWRPLTQTTWRGNFDDPQFDVEYEILSGPASPTAPFNTNTRDGGANNHQRIFTWEWNGHANQQGFSYGSSVSDGANNTTSYLWESGNENHAIPYTEVYIRSLNGGPSKYFVSGTETLVGTQENMTIQSTVDGAKIVRVDQNVTSDGFLSLAEVQAFETGTGNNVALTSAGGSAWQTSEGWGGAAARAIDGNTDGNYNNGSVTHTGNGDSSPAWQVTLANPSDLDAIHVWTRSDCCHARSNDFNLIILDDQNNELYNQQHTGVGSDPGSNRWIPLGPFTADLVATLNPHDHGAGFTYAFDLGTDMLSVANPDPNIFTTYLDLNGAALEVGWAGGEIPAGLALGDTFDLLDADVIDGMYDSLVLPELPGFMTWNTDMFMTNGTLTVAPEPSTFALAAFGLLGLGWFGCRRRKT